MEYAYLGLFSSVFEWVLSRIIDPVYRFVSGLLMTVFTWLFEEILAPILMPVLKEALNFFIELWLEIFSNQLYLLFSGILKLIDYLETAFDVFIGLRDVTYTQTDGSVVTGSLVEVLIQQKTISTVFWVLTLGALGLALILTIYATAKSAFDLDFENKRPVSKVLGAMMKTFIQFFMVPFLVYFLLKLSAVILKGVTSTLSFGGATSLGRIIFMIASLKAAKDDSFNLGSDTALNIEFGTSSADTVRYPFYTMTGGNGIAVKDYGNIKEVSEAFKLASFDYLIGFIAAVFILFTIGVCLIVFVQRIFELMLLYLASPYFVCMIPLDDGERFSRWREMFTGKCFSGFGSVIGMRLFLLVCPMVMGNRIKFGAATSPEMDYMMKLFFLAGGAWAVYKSGSMITSLLSSQAGMSESNTAAVAGGMLFSHTVGYAMAKGQQVMRTGLSRMGGQRAAAAAGAGAGGAGAAGAGAKGRGLSERESGKFTGSKGAGGDSSKDKIGIGTRLKNTAKASTEAAAAVKGIKSTIKGPDKSFKGAARQMIRSYDSLHNIKRAYKGKEKSSGLEMKIDKSVEAIRHGASALGGDFIAVEDSLRGTLNTVAKTHKTMQNGSFRNKVYGVADSVKSIYGTSKKFARIGEHYEEMKKNVREGWHYKEDLGDFKLTLSSDNSVLSRDFPGTKFSQNPVEDPVKLKTNFESMGLFDDLESSASSGGSDSDGSESIAGSGSSSSGSGDSKDSGSSGSKGSSKPRSVGNNGTYGTLSNKGKSATWTSAKVRPYEVRCTVPAVQKVTVTSGKSKVNYKSLSVRGVQFKGRTGNGQRTRRNSI